MKDFNSSTKGIWWHSFYPLWHDKGGAGGKKDAPVPLGFPRLEFQPVELESAQSSAGCSPLLTLLSKEGKCCRSEAQRDPAPPRLCAGFPTPLSCQGTKILGGFEGTIQREQGCSRQLWILSSAHLSTRWWLRASHAINPFYPSRIPCLFISSCKQTLCDRDGLFKGSWELLDVFISSIYNRFLQINSQTINPGLFLPRLKAAPAFLTDVSSIPSPPGINSNQKVTSKTILAASYLFS